MKNGKKYIMLLMALLLILTLGQNIATAKDEKITKEIVEEYHNIIEENKEDIIIHGYDCPMCGSNTRTSKVGTSERYVDTVTNPPGYSPGVYRRYEIIGHYQLTCFNSSSCGYKASFNVSEGYKYVRV